MKDKRLKIIRDYGVAVFVALILAYTIRTYGFEIYKTSGTQMSPALYPGDTFFAWKNGWFWNAKKELMPGDVVVFHLSTEESKEVVKRVIALENETIEVLQGEVWVNGKKISEHTENREDFCFHEKRAQKSWRACRGVEVMENLPAMKIPAGHVFLLSDDRAASVKNQKRLNRWDVTSLDQILAKSSWVWLSVHQERGGGFFSKIRFRRMFQRVQ